MSVTKGIKLSSDITAAATSAGVGQAPDRRRLYDFSDRVAELAPEESPFFVYLSQVAKSPTDDSVFRYLENRSKINMTTRNFLIAGAVGTIAAESSYTFVVDADTATGGVESGGSAVDFLIKGMVFVVNTTTGAETSGYAQAMVRIETAPVSGSVSTSFTGKVISLSNANVSGYNSVADNDVCQVIGTAFAEGTASPDTFSTEIEDDFGFTQIFKTSCELSNTAIATRYRGYANEFERIWATKLREHKVDIERAMLFGQKARVGGVQYTEGLVGHIVKNANPTTDDSSFAYSSGVPYYRSVAQAELTYDRLLADLEVIFDPARGGSADRLVLASLPVITFFNKLGDGAFMDASMGASGSINRYNFEERQGQFGHKIMTIDTVHGTMHLVKEPLFRGLSSGFMLMADMSKLMYRPLVGNGLNRDTHIITNVQNSDEDLRKDMVITEAGLEVTLPECHALYEVESV
jgi:hypothetical protein